MGAKRKVGLLSMRANRFYSSESYRAAQQAIALRAQVEDLTSALKLVAASPSFVPEEHPGVVDILEKV